jgi:hypothetical protein
VELEITPPVAGAEREALRDALVDALAKAGATLELRTQGYDGGWRRTAAREAVDNEPARPGYARSPRSTRGATSA